MERNNLKDNNLGGGGGGGGGGGKSMNVKSPWECSSSNNTSNFSEEYISGFSWPPRSYICSFCKREFRSAQALGGHMNVHRRDRARLRQSPPPAPPPLPLPLPPRNHTIPNLNLNPNPNPNFSSTPLSSPRSPPTRLVQPSSPPLSSSYTACCTLPSLVSPSSIERKKSVDDNNASTQVLLNNSRSPSSKKGSDLAREKTAKSLFEVREFSGCFSQENGNVVLKNTEIVGLELGIGLNGDLKDEDHVDLELRLGYS